MNIKSIIDNLKNKGVYLFMDGNDIICRTPKGVMTDDIRNQIRQHKKEILKLLIIENPYNLPVKRPRTKPIQNNLPTNGSMIRLIQRDCLDALKNIEDDSVDQLVTDPPYGIKFMGKNWDKALPCIEIWIEVLRVLKPGAFAFIMALPRQDVLSRMIRILEEAGFVIGFTSLYWTYANGFPKAHNIGKAVCKNLVGSYAGFQPKPAVEIILVVMKQCKEKSYTKQALADGKGITWLDNCRISYRDSKLPWKYKDGVKWSPEKNGIRIL